MSTRIKMSTDSKKFKSLPKSKEKGKEKEKSSSKSKIRTDQFYQTFSPPVSINPIRSIPQNKIYSTE
jgi:hypothetical protein